MIYRNIKKIMALTILSVVISLGTFVGAQQSPPPQQDPPKRNPPEIPVGNKDRDKPNNNQNKGNEPKNNDKDKPKKP
jgi:hypothetical protein